MEKSKVFIHQFSETSPTLRLVIHILVPLPAGVLHDPKDVAHPVMCLFWLGEVPSYCLQHAHKSWYGAARDCGQLLQEINLMHEAVPLAFLSEQAGGKATDGYGYRILNIEPIHREECMPAFMGCSGDVDELESFGTVRVEELHPPVSAFSR